MKKLFLFFFFFIFPLVALADARTELSQYLNQLHSMQAHFSQTIRDGQGRILDQSQGEMALLRPGKFYWETQSPQHQLVIANQNIVWIYDKELEQITKQKQQAGGFSPALLLSASNQNLLQNFTITKTQDARFLLDLKKNKKNDDVLFARLILEFSQGSLKSMALEDKLGQITSIRFTEVKFNPSLPPSRFEFTPPKGVDVADNTGL